MSTLRLTKFGILMVVAGPLGLGCERANPSNRESPEAAALPVAASGPTSPTAPSVSALARMPVVGGGPEAVPGPSLETQSACRENLFSLGSAALRACR